MATIGAKNQVQETKFLQKQKKNNNWPQYDTIKLLASRVLTWLAKDKHRNRKCMRLTNIPMYENVNQNQLSEQLCWIALKAMVLLYTPLAVLTIMAGSMTPGLLVYYSHRDHGPDMI